MQPTKTTNQNLNLLKPFAKEVFLKLLNECYNRGINAKISESLRSNERQKELYKAGKSKAKEGFQSMHFYGIACDVFVNDNGKYDLSKNCEIWKICQELKLDIDFGMVWGGNFKNFKDEPHFELSYGKSWREFYKIYLEGSKVEPRQNSIFNFIISEFNHFINFWF